MELMIHKEHNECITPLTISESLINFSISQFHGANVEFIRQVSEHLKVYYESYDRLDAKRIKDESN